MDTKSDFKKWYEANGKAHNEARKKKYHTDKAYRDTVKERAAEYRRENPAPSRAGMSSMKTVGGKLVRVYRLGEVAGMIGRSQQTIRKWEAEGYIPKPSVKSAHRFYTDNQVKLMSELADLIEVTWKGSREVFSTVVATKRAEISANWNVV